MKIFIGNSSNYLDNKQCGGVYLANPDQVDASNPDYTTFSSSKGTNSMWSFGLEAWCNMEGRYLYFEANYSLLTDATVSICNLGIMGTKYVRDTPVPTQLTIDLYDTVPVSVSVQDFYAEIPIANTINPQVRQAIGAELDWVSISNSFGGFSEVRVDRAA